ncbi:MAG: hypothetical protein M2R45_00685 [Verrucomicrobia subdivision 3 bacterium]|nr:hypothetical protein [Limisphaerales bacterium]MCS1414431.1 hypothetical protein [Limisphaerales bacterium]
MSIAWRKRGDVIRESAAAYDEADEAERTNSNLCQRRIEEQIEKYWADFHKQHRVWHEANLRGYNQCMTMRTFLPSLTHLVINYQIYFAIMKTINYIILAVFSCIHGYLSASAQGLAKPPFFKGIGNS